MVGNGRSALSGQSKLCEPSFLQGYLSSREVCVIFSLSTDCSWMHQLAYILSDLESNVKPSNNKEEKWHADKYSYIYFFFLPVPPSHCKEISALSVVHPSLWDYPSVVSVQFAFLSWWQFQLPISPHWGSYRVSKSTNIFIYEQSVVQVFWLCFLWVP